MYSLWLQKLCHWKTFWLWALLTSLLLNAYGREWLPRWSLKFPRQWELPLRHEISAFMNWLVEDASFGLFSFRELTRGIAWLLDIPLQIARSFFSTGLMQGVGSDAVQLLPPLPWLGVITVVAALGYCAKDLKLALLVAACFGYLAVFGQWQSAMDTLASILITVPIGVAGGLFLGIMSYRHRWVEKLLSPLLDLMQTIPIFAYLVPILFLFGFGPVAAMVGTIIYAMPPMVRITLQALQGVPPELVEFGRMAGCLPRQLLWKVLIPSARPGLMIGVNQVIMLSLNMVIIASMIGAGGLGYDVLTSLRRLDIGAGLESGLAIVVLAVALDRLSQAFASKSPVTPAVHASSFVARHAWLLGTAGLIGVMYLLGFVIPSVQSYPESLQLTTGSGLSEAVKWLNINMFDYFEAVKSALLLNILIPLKRFLIALPWGWVICLLAILGWQLGRWKLCLLVLGLALFILLTGQWQKAMITVYLCGISVIIAGLIGIPLGIFAAGSERSWRIMQVIIDTLQTLPSFVYLIPVVMLFRVGDFSAMIAVVLYAITPAIRYTAHGIRSVDPQLIEAGTVSGCTKAQLLWKIRLPMAMPDILLGINQTIMLALSMLVITALVGTRDLGQEVYIALTKADTGHGMVAGLSIAAIAIIADRLIAARARHTRQRLGLN
ncbi:MAG: ABC transporter permease subunit [Oceanospirillaceae bacterium]|nr:ABC transporter permease subunit [Oceanospirillaceae bacterium]